MSETRPEYVKCVSRNGSPSESVCGRYAAGPMAVWMFVDWTHADRNESNGGRCLTCDDCKAARIRAAHFRSALIEALNKS